MSLILSTKIKATLPELVQQYSQPEYQSHEIELWVFNDKKSRQSAEKQLQMAGINAKIRSAYKPLLHFVLEELDINEGNLEKLDIRYPVNDHCQPNRFALESYPLGGILGLNRVNLIENRARSLTYEIDVVLKTGEKFTHHVLAPSSVNKSITCDRHLSPSGWVRINDPQGNRVTDKSIVTDYEQVFETITQAITHHSWRSSLFEELNINVQGPMFDEELPYVHEHVSLSEALHEDLYFTIQEWFKYRAGKAPHDRSFRFGQVIPNIVSQQGDYDIKMSLDPYTQSNQEMPWQELEYAQRPLSSSQISLTLDEVEGKRIIAQSVAGRPINAVYHYGSELPVMVSGGQHANETTGIVGALRAAKQLATRPTAHFLVSPLENPDGYETFLRLLQTNPNHMHHAARYTAMGNDLDTHIKEQAYENSIRLRAFANNQVKLHINLHGYPCHEWVRPLSGYIPAGFDKWTLPKGFFLVLRYSNDEIYQDCGRELLWQLTKRLAEIPQLVEFNQRQIDLFSFHAQNRGIKVLNNIPCIVSKEESSPVPLQLISEFPDETIYGQDFKFGHNVQKAVVLEAYDIFQSVMNSQGKSRKINPLF
ncbi:M14 family zinc carboxypeptidase [Vibrio sp. RC27]